MMAFGCCNPLGILMMGGVHLLGLAILVGLTVFLVSAVERSLQRDFPNLRQETQITI